MARITRRAALLSSIALSTRAAARGFVRAQGKDLVAADGSKLFLRGINLGNWLVPEGYMFRFGSWPASAREIAGFFNELAGPSYGARFWTLFRDRYITEADIRFVRQCGFNSVRVPFDYRLVEDGAAFPLLDRVIGWCRQAGLWVVLDMHCAPGGQTGSNIDNSWGYPWLFESEDDQRRTAAIWRSIAARYRQETAVLGYDLLNEPIPHYPPLPAKYNARLEPVYRRIAAAIREVDRNHVLILGGAQWDSNFDVFGPPFDPNSMYTFHKYWTEPTRKVIEPYLAFRDRHEVPIWMGESGENNDNWITSFTATLEENGVGWCYWPYKKMEAASAVASFKKPQGWDNIRAYAKVPGGTGSMEARMKIRPPVEAARAALDELLENIRFENCRTNSGYLKALGRTTPA